MDGWKSFGFNQLISTAFMNAKNLGLNDTVFNVLQMKNVCLALINHEQIPFI